HISAFHEDLAHLLPGGTHHLHAASVAVAGGTPQLDANPVKNTSAPEWTASLCARALQFSLRQMLAQHTADWQPGDGVQALTSAAAELVLNLQLLSAGLEQRHPQEAQQQYDTAEQPRQAPKIAGKGEAAPVNLLASSSALLHLQVRAVLQHGSTSLKVLQKAGLQLLQALAAPVQQQQLSSSSSSSNAAAEMQPEESEEGAAGQASYALRAAACGLAQLSVLQTAPPPKQLPCLALDHTAAYTSLIECCVHSPTLQAADMLAAAELLALANAVCGAAAGISGRHSRSVSGTSSQASASAALLAVVLSRSIVQLADAMDTAGPQLLFDFLAAKPCYRVMWTAS
ncbi:hypothetical protein COO60DRAFT_1685666, partial [Scenedesmus sp. NREL 46B-D3]